MNWRYGVTKIGSTFIIQFFLGVSIGQASLDCTYNANTRNEENGVMHPIFKILYSCWQKYVLQQPIYVLFLWRKMYSIQGRSPKIFVARLK